MTEPNEAGESKLAAILRKVRRLVAIAEHEIADTATAEERAGALQEQDRARAQADALMLQYAIDQAMIADAEPAATRGTPKSIAVPLASEDRTDDNLPGYVAWLCSEVAKHCRCLARNYASYDREQKVWISTVYGFSGDVGYFDVLYTTLRLHMLDVVRPSYRASESLELNAYRMHNAGYNWLEICEAMGWRKLGYDQHHIRQRHPEMDAASDKAVWYVRNKGQDNEEVATATKIGSEVKRAYHRAVKAKGEQPTVISANGAKTYRRSALEGYVTRIGARLRTVEDSRDFGSSGALVLANQAERLEDWVRDQHPERYTRCPNCGKLSDSKYDCDRCGHHIEDQPVCPECERLGHPCRLHKPRKSTFKPQPFNQAAYQSGRAHADTADLTGHRSTSTNSKPQIG
jgi:hypothetical protein